MTGSDDEVRAVTGTVSGRVHGVGFRISTQWEADRLGLAGWVRNLPDGTVEVFVQGTSSRVDELVVWLRHGPRAARVDRVAITEVALDPTLRSFTIR